MTLFNAKVGAKLRVVQIMGGRGVRGRLYSMGLNIGDYIRVIQIAPFRGTFFIENLSNGTKFAIGRGVAAKILVEYAEK